MEFLFLLAGLAIGVALMWLWLRGKVSDTSTEEINDLRDRLNESNTYLSRAEERGEQLDRQVRELKEKLDKESNEVRELSSALSSSKTVNGNLQQRLEEQKAEVEQLQERFTKEFKLIANDLLEEKSKKFTEQNKLNLDNILNPLSEKIKDFEKKVDETHKANLLSQTALKEQLLNLKEMHNQMSKEASNLTKALKGESKTQGNWGEMILERLLERSGLVRDREYFIQESFTTEDGRRLQPDVVLKLPDDKNIIIDSKVSLTAYERYCSAEDEEAEKGALKEHLTSIRAHVKGLSNKKYQHEYDLKSLDFVLLFVPIEPAFGLAAKHDSALFNEAYEKQVVIVTTSTLLATLHTIASIWRQEYQNQNALEIAKKSGDLYDKFVGFMDDLVDIGKKMQSTKDSYDKAMNKLTKGRGNLVSRVENIKKLGARTSKALSEKILVRALEEEEDEQY